MATEDFLTGEPSLATNEERQWGMFLHFSSLASYIVPLAGIVIPIVLWQMKKDQWPAIDRHGREVMNFTVSYFIYIIVSAILSFVLIGIPLLFILGLLVVIFPIIAGIKANAGEFWRYPGTIKFFG